eukprot:symbB.v1.2.024596.t1/scaffold2341.1/size81865/4
MEEILKRVPPDCQEKFEELSKKYGFGDVEVTCFEMNTGARLSSTSMSSFEGFLQEQQRSKRMPKKQLLLTARPLTASTPGDLKRGPAQVMTPVTKRTREAVVADLDAGTPAPPPKPTHQISVKSSINTGKLEKIQLSQTADVKLVGDQWTGGREAYRWMDETLSERAARRDERLQEWEASITSTLHKQVTEAVIGTVGVPSQVETILCGRIACEGLEGRLNEHSMLLEGSTLAAAKQVQLNVANCNRVAAIPGQIVGVVGRSGMTGNTFHAKEFLPGLPQEPQPLADACQLHALVVAGPFTQKNVLDFTALQTVLVDLAESRDERPEVLGKFHRWKGKHSLKLQRHPNPKQLVQSNL